MRATMLQSLHRGFALAMLAGALPWLAAIPAHAAAAEGATKRITELRTGTAHDALFGLSLDGEQGVVVGTGGAILETADGGKTWTSVNDKPILNALLAVDWHGKFGIAVGQGGLTMVRVDGAGWKKVATGSKSRLFSVSVNRFGTAVAAGEFGTILKTVDGGVTWTSVAPMWAELVQLDGGGGADPHLYFADIDDAGTITVAGEFGLILRSTDGGGHWSALNKANEAAPSIFSLYLPPGGQGNSYAVGQRGAILISADDGKDWQPATPSGTQSNFLGVTVDGKGRVVVTGMRVMVVSADQGATWTPVEEGDTTTDWYQTVRTEKVTGRAIAVGHAGKIIAIDG